MSAEHLIEPPEDLVKQWSAAIYDQTADDDKRDLFIAVQASRWGWSERDATVALELQKARDEELEACLQLIQTVDDCLAIHIRRARRPSLKQSAYDALNTYVYGNPDSKDKERTYNTIRAALETLPNG